MSKILVVEDNANVRNTVGRILEDCGHFPVYAPSGEDALIIMQQQDGITAGIIDLTLPGMDGIELFQYIRDGIEDFTGIAITANYSYESEQACQQAGFSAYVRKPLEQDFVTMVEAL